MKPALSLNIGRVGFFRRTVMSQWMMYPARKDRRIKPIWVLFMLEHAEIARLVVDMSFNLILLVLRSVQRPQINDPVVGLAMVDVINVMFRPNAVDVKPSQPVCKVPLAADAGANADLYVASIMQGAGDAANASPLGDKSPSEKPGFWVVMKQFAQAFRCKIGSSHAAVLSLIDQRPGAIATRLQASPL